MDETTDLIPPAENQNGENAGQPAPRRRGRPRKNPLPENDANENRQPPRRRRKNEEAPLFEEADHGTPATAPRPNDDEQLIELMMKKLGAEATPEEPAAIPSTPAEEPEHQSQRSRPEPGEPQQQQRQQ